MNCPVSERKKKCLLGTLCFGIAMIFLAICSKSSFLYPINDWEDANIFFTAGKSIVHGKVLYRDVYDHKGPLLYFLHSLAYLISNDTFLGVYWIEVAAFAAYLLAAYKTLRLFVKENIWQMLPLLALLILTSQSFCHGDSAEELCLPLVAWSLYASLNYFKNIYPKDMEYKELFLHGILAGCIMLIKFTLLGFHFGWMLMILISCVLKKDWKRGILSGLVFVGGMLVTTIPFFVYFGLNQALDSWFTGYIYNNIFLYSNANQKSIVNMLKGMLVVLIDAFTFNLSFSVFVILGVTWMTLKKQGIRTVEKCNIWMLCVCTSMGITWGVSYLYPYYPLILSVFACLGFIPFLKWIESKQKKISRVSFVVLIIFCLWGAYKWGNYTDEIGKNREDVVQYQFAEIIQERENPSLLSFGCMDGGFYTVTNIVPECKYFTKTNLPGNDWIDMQITFLTYGWVDYVVTQDYPLSDEYVLYELVATGTNRYERLDHTYYLYRNLSDEDKIPWQD